MEEEGTQREPVRAHPVRSLRVEVVKGPDAGKSVVSREDSVTIGTAEGNDLVLTDGTVSRYHLEVRRADGRIAVEDHGSTNGISLAGALIERATISPGTVLGLGKSAIKVTDGESYELPLHRGERFGRVVGRSPVMRNLLSRVERAAKSDVSVLLLGETGTGKEVFARAIHEGGARASKPFETVDCGSLLPTLIASELFGHERGAFTGADRQHIGAFERADGGTLFLDEIGELPMTVQASLLGALERRSFKRVGGTKPLSVDVRVIAATHRDLRAEVNKGTFREDLYYRVAVLLLRLPPLRERPNDIPVLAEHFLREAGWDGEVESILSPKVMAALEKHRWRGNARELRNFVESALAIGEAPSLEGPTHGEVPIAREPSRLPQAPFPTVPLAELLERPYRQAREALTDDFERAYLRRLMERAHGNVSLAARDAKMDRSYLTELLKRHQIR